MSNFDFEHISLKDECIIVPKVYDQCREQVCLTPEVLGTAFRIVPGTPEILGPPVNPPNNAVAVVIQPNTYKIASVQLVSKTPSQFKRGYFDIELKYVFQYSLEFRGADGLSLPTPISPVLAGSVYNQKLTLFGSESTGVVNVLTDFASLSGNLQEAPFVYAEAKAVPLEAALVFTTACTPPDVTPLPSSINVTIGLFSIVKLIRLVELVVESKGFCTPEPCEQSLETPCDIFNSLDFPFDAFNPPHKEDFFKAAEDLADEDL